MDLNKAKKYLNLMKEFDVESDSMEKNIEIIETEILEDLTPEQYKKNKQSIINTKILIEDFDIIRKTLKDNIKSISTLITRLGNELTVTNSDDINPDMLKGYSDLIKSNNQSMKLLIENYEKIAKIQTEVKKFMSNEEEISNNKEPTKTINNNVFVGSTKDLIDNLLN